MYRSCMEFVVTSRKIGFQVFGVKGFKPCQVTYTDVVFFGIVVGGSSLKGHSCVF